MRRLQSLTSGFTLIEMIVSLGVFSVVVTIATGALLMLIAGNQRYYNEQNVMTNLSFAIDSMTREIRTGSGYYCISSASDLATYNQEQHGTLTQNCVSGGNGSAYHGLSFVEGGNSITGNAITGSATRIMYYYDRGKQTLFRKVGSDVPQSIISDEIAVLNADFFATSTRRVFSGGDRTQPAVTIYLEARPRTSSTTPERVQTTVTQRSLDL